MNDKAINTLLVVFQYLLCPHFTPAVPTHFLKSCALALHNCIYYA